MTVEKRAAKVPLTRKPRVPMARGSVMGCVASNAPTHPFPTSTADAFKGRVMARSRSRASRSMAEAVETAGDSEACPASWQRAVRSAAARSA